jgi:hypothetical protein
MHKVPVQAASQLELTKILLGLESEGSPAVSRVMV